ncbi:hypothetical protein GCM10017764_29130 [Sphingobacterium griseoflavum]|uniref:GH18 domain-containing protein n=1 Tax=Sphingobacterium griseoflavum TaxID=1474952 RepID=A0ABQ3HXB6_9SPHI|nr:hypothetical protein GCM10017764_29130 [Sphingobacterium griseoflavum]
MDVSFYYWKTSFKPSEAEEQALQDNQSRRIYIRYFDVGLTQGKPFPISAIVFKKIPKQEIVPVVYIKNEVLLSPATDVPLLADRILAYIVQINDHYGVTTPELQLDCDWSLKSKDAFFLLVKELKTKWKGVLSCTIRLHQVKYFEKTGIPPVDYGVLMYYNMGTISANQSNSIYDRNTAKRYISSLAKYPLPLKVALPIFGWGVHLRHGKVVNLINRLEEQEVAALPTSEKTEGGKYKITRAGTYFGQLFALGDEIKLESVDPKMLLEMASDLKKHLTQQPTEIIFYDLDQTNIRRHGKDFFQEIASRFR